MPAPVRAWHAFAAHPDPAALQAMLAPDVVFRSPAVHHPQDGPRLTFAYLWAAVQVLGPTLTYHEEWYSESSAVLEFTARLGEGEATRDVQGIDMIRWNAEGLITEFTVMARPLRGLEALIAQMAEALRIMSEQAGEQSGEQGTERG
ncbi:nuclear transport factor 2 family protein [Nocardioidaceae bacterium]|nr:nuclear transport factor 2 family protein [Nocardioidaceae bacterium]